jgi:carboxyl-terminal processing protease
VKAIALLLAMALVFSLGFVLGSLQSKDYEFSETFLQRSAEIISYLKNSYFKPNTTQAREVSDATLEDGMLHGLADGLGDPYTRYFNDEELAEHSASMAESYVGIGVLLSLGDDGFPVVVRVYKDSPAKRAGIEENDVIVGIDGQDLVAGTELIKVAGRLRGEAGTKVSVSVMRQSKRREFDLVRAAVAIEYVSARMINKEIGYISLSEFSMQCNVEVKQAIEALQAQGMKKLIFDLRSNPGGYVEPAVRIADLFLDEGLVAYTQYADGERKDYRSDAAKLNIPVVVLVNENSASASEIVVGALKDRGAATVVGQKTYGKGIIQLLYPLSKGGALNITIAGYFTPSGTSIHGVGITPDVIVGLPANVLNGTVKLTPDNDTQLQKAIELLK